MAALTMLFAVLALFIGYRVMRKPKSSQNIALISDLSSQVEPHMMPQVIQSDYGGWQGTYTEEQLRSVQDVESRGDSKFSIGDVEPPPPEIFFNTNSPATASNNTEDDLRLIEGTNTDEELMRAYEAAMAVDIEPEDPHVEALMSGSPGAVTGMGTMSGIGSTPNTHYADEDDREHYLPPGQPMDLPPLT